MMTALVTVHDGTHDNTLEAVYNGSQGSLDTENVHQSKSASRIGHCHRAYTNAKGWDKAVLS